MISFYNTWSAEIKHEKAIFIQKVENYPQQD